MKINATLTDRQCRHAESRMRTCAESGGIKEGDKVIVTADKCNEASGRFFYAMVGVRGGKFNEIIKPNVFTKDEIKAILSRLE